MLSRLYAHGVDNREVCSQQTTLISVAPLSISDLGHLMVSFEKMHCKHKLDEDTAYHPFNDENPSQVLRQ